MRTRIFQIVQIARKGDRASRLYDMFIVGVALASIVPLMFHIERLPEIARFAITALDVVSVYLLFFDYLLRWMTHDIKEGRRGDWKALVRYPFTLQAIIDLAAILPSLGVLPANFMFLRALRIFRVMRYSRQLTVVANVFASEKKTLVSVLALVCLYVFITALIMFCNEPGTFDTFVDALYWSAVTLTTIGYGDIHPATQLGEIIVIASSIFGILVIALPAGIITGSFLDQLRKMQNDRERYFETSDSTQRQNRGSKPFSVARMKAYLRSQPRVAVYSAHMAAYTAFGLALYCIMSIVGFPVWLDTTGTALATCMLEPAAGFIVGFVTSLVLALVNGNAGNLLFYAECAVVVIVYGHFLEKWRLHARHDVAALRAVFTIAVIQTAMSFAIDHLLQQGVIVTPFQTLYATALGLLGLPSWLAYLIALFIDRILDAIAVYFVVATIGKALIKNGSDPQTVIKLRIARSKGTQTNPVPADEPHSQPKQKFAQDTPRPNPAAKGAAQAPRPPRKRLWHQTRAPRPRR